MAGPKTNPSPALKTNVLYYGDNLDVLRKHIPDESVDLIYLDPPFNSNRSYNVLFKETPSAASQAQIEAFEDTWHWGKLTQDAFEQIALRGGDDTAKLLQAMVDALGHNDVTAYLTMMAIRLVELRRALKPSGCIYLHCDPTASHYLKVLMDSVFGPKNFLSEIVWKRSSAHSDTKQGRKNYGHIHDVLLFYARSDSWTWHSIHTPYQDEYVSRDYRLVENETGRRFRRGDLTAARPGGDTEYEWRVKKREGMRERWMADLDEEYRNPKPGWEYKGVRPYKGRYWAYSSENMRQFAQEGSRPRIAVKTRRCSLRGES